MPSSTDPFNYEFAVEACARGERFALRALYEREARWLLGVAQRIGRDRDTAQDVLQDAFLLVCQRASTYQRSLGCARGWIYTVVRHRALDGARRIRRETFISDDHETIADTTVTAQALQAMPHSDVEALYKCLNTLDERKRDCIASAFVEGCTHEQIAQKLAAPVGTVKSWIRRGLLALKDWLS